MLDRLDRNDRLQLMKFVCSFAWADLEIRPEEREHVADLIKRLDLDDDEARQVEGWLKLPPRPESVDPTTIPVEHRRLFVGAVEAVVLADGELAEEEADSLDIFRSLVA